MAYPDSILYQCKDGQSPEYTVGYVDGNRPSISSVTGSITNGSTITLNGFFSNKRNGQLFTRIATPAQAGQELVPSYIASTSDSWLGSGASLLCETTAGNQWKLGGGTPIINHEIVDEIYYSYNFKLSFLNYGLSAEAPQIKFPRPLVVYGHEGAMSPILFFAETNAGLDLFLEDSHKFTGGWNGSPASCYYDKDGTELTPLFNQWCKFVGYYKCSTPGVKNGSVFQMVKNEQDQSLFFNVYSSGINGNDQRFTTTLTPFAEPVYYFDSNNEQQDGAQFWLFFYKRNSTVVNVYMDGIIANDSPESVWLINGTNFDTAMTAGKAVHIPQLTRTATQITATCYLGNLLTSDNVYAVVMNSNGRASTPVLVRAAT